MPILSYLQLTTLLVPGIGANFHPLDLHQKFALFLSCGGSTRGLKPMHLLPRCIKCRFHCLKNRLHSLLWCIPSPPHTLLKQRREFNVPLLRIKPSSVVICCVCSPFAGAHATFCEVCSELQEVYNIDFERFIQVSCPACFAASCFLFAFSSTGPGVLLQEVKKLWKTKVENQK